MKNYLISMIAIIAVGLGACGTAIQTKNPKPTEQTYSIAAPTGEKYTIEILNDHEGTVTKYDSEGNLIDETAFTYALGDIALDIGFIDGTSITITGHVADNLQISALSVTIGGNTNTPATPSAAASPIAGVLPTTPFVPQSSAKTVTSLSMTPEHSCAILDAEELWCWGQKNNQRFGLLGSVSTPSDQPHFVSAVNSNGLAIVQTYNDFTYVMSKKGRIHLFGYGTFKGEALSFIPQVHALFAMNPDNDASTTCIIAAGTKALYCWKTGEDYHQNIAPLLLKDIADISFISSSELLVVQDDDTLALLNFHRGRVALAAPCPVRDVEYATPSSYLLCTDGSLWSFHHRQPDSFKQIAFAGTGARLVFENDLQIVIDTVGQALRVDGDTLTTIPQLQDIKAFTAKNHEHFCAIDSQFALTCVELKDSESAVVMPTLQYIK